MLWHVNESSPNMILNTSNPILCSVNMKTQFTPQSMNYITRKKGTMVSTFFRTKPTAVKMSKDLILFFKDHTQLEEYYVKFETVTIKQKIHWLVKNKP